jgi:alpha-tubulin suppressor-like RCC1 family protein
LFLRPFVLVLAPFIFLALVSGCSSEPDGDSPGNNTPDNNTPGNNTPGNNTPDNNTPDNNTPENNAPDNNAPDNNVPMPSVTVEILSGPQALTRATEASFEFGCSGASDCTFVCSLNGAEPEPCSSPLLISGLGDGEQGFSVVASAGGVQSAPAVWSWMVDTVAPVVESLTGPASVTNVASAAFTFDCSETGCEFECSFDGGAFTSCESGVTFEDLADGNYTFAVRASDEAGNVGVAVEWEWTIDTVAPVVESLMGPASLSNVPTPIFTFDCSEADCTFICTLGGTSAGELDSGACTSGVSYSDLADDTYTFSVVATDLVGNTGLAATWSWTLDTVEPQVEFMAIPPLESFETVARAEFECTNKSDCSFECAVSWGNAQFAPVTGEWEACESAYTLEELYQGDYVLYVRATDGAGNVGSADVGWTVLANDWVQMSTGSNHTCAVRADGTLWCWGKNSSGQLGLGDDTSRPSPAQVGEAKDWTAVSAGENHTCGVRRGELWCWGDNWQGQLGLGDSTTRLSPARVGVASDWSAVSAASIHTCGLRGSTLWCWGGNWYGELGVGDTAQRTSPVQVGLASDWSLVSAGGQQTCGLRSGALWCWGAVSGEAQRSSPAQVGVANDWSAVSPGLDYTCGLRGGTLWCWGQGWTGQLGLGDTTESNVPTRVGTGSDWSDVSASQFYTCGLRGGELWCWGINRDGQLGLGDTTPRNVPERVGTGSDWSEVSVSYHHTCGLRSGDLWCWGLNSDGQLGVGEVETHALTPVSIAAQDSFSEVAAGGGHTCAIRVDGTLWCWGRNWEGQLGNAMDFINRQWPMQIGTANDWSKIRAGDRHTCGLRGGSLWCWGFNENGQLGSGSGNTRDSNGPNPVGGANDWTDVSLSWGHTCGVRGGTLWCWGANESGQLGRGFSESHPMEVYGDPVRVGSESDWSAVAAGSTHTCGLRSGTLWCWGNGWEGQLGVGSGLNRTLPEQVGTANDWSELTAGSNHTCGLRGGALWCWGRGWEGQLGLGDNGARSFPVQVGAESDWTAVSAGAGHTCGVQAGSLWCWGDNWQGMLGLGDILARNSPVQVGTADDWSEVSAGSEHTCGLRGGALSCWGSNLHGALGDGAGSRVEPVLVPEPL